jgi:hypothetical protein
MIPKHSYKYGTYYKNNNWFLLTTNDCYQGIRRMNVESENNIDLIRIVEK